MLIGVPKEIKTHEYRVGLTPGAVRALLHHGHQVMVETRAGAAIGYDDALYHQAGALIADNAEEVFAHAELVVKVKEPQPAECVWLRPGQGLFTYLHLAADKALTERLLASGVIAIAYETVTDATGGLPLLAPMSEVAGRLAIQVGAHCLEQAQGGRGVLLGGATGVGAATVVVLGAGVVGTNAARMALGLEARVVVLDTALPRLAAVDLRFGSRVQTLYASMEAIDDQVRAADLVIGAVLRPGAAAPKLVSQDLLGRMQRGSAVVDVAIDQGGCFETSRPTTHAAPTYVLDGVVHYCVTNMPGAVAGTSTQALGNATLPFVLALAERGVVGALAHDPHLRRGLNVCRGHLTCPAVAEAHGLAFTDAEVPAPEG